MYKRIIVKIGTGVISRKNGQLDGQVLRHLVDQAARLRTMNAEVIIVTSGAVGTGRGLITPKNGNGSVVSKQVLAAVGQVQLMSMYAEQFKKYGILCAQVLATKEDFRDKEHYLNMKNCLESLLRNNVVPVMNENDAVAVAELMFTDNDELAGLIASQLKADAVIMLTSVEGVLTGPPGKPSSTVIHEIGFTDIASYQKYVTKDTSSFGRGGMHTKFSIAKKLASQGITTHVANGRRRDVLTDIQAGKPVGTRFLPRRKQKRS